MTARTSRTTLRSILTATLTATLMPCSAGITVPSMSQTWPALV